MAYFLANVHPKYDGLSVSEGKVPSGYLMWCIRHITDNPELVAACKEEYNRRKSIKTKRDNKRKEKSRKRKAYFRKLKEEKNARENV